MDDPSLMQVQLWRDTRPGPDVAPQTNPAKTRYAIMPAATVLLLASSMTMKLPVARSIP